MGIYKKVTIFQGGSGSDDKKAKVSADDTQSAFLEDKIIAASNKVDVSVFNPGGIEQLEIDINESNIDHDALLNFDAAEHAPLNDLSTTSSSLWSSQKTQDELDTKVSKAGDTMTGILNMDNTYINVSDADGESILHPDYLDVYNQAGDRGATISKTQSYFGYYTGGINPYIEMNYNATTANIKIYDALTNDPILPVSPEDVVVKQYADTKVSKVASTDNAITRFDGTSGNVQNSGVSIDDSNNITGVNDLTVTGNLTVNGTTTTVNTINTDITDANITLNKGGDQASANAQDSGITVEMSDATDAIIGYDSTLASKFKIGEVGAEYEITSTGHTQTLTNKTVDADNNTISNLETDNLKVGVLVTDTTMTGVLDTQIPSALAIKTYVDNGLSAQNQASEISYDPTGNVEVLGSNVQTALDDVDASLQTKASATDLTNHINDVTDAHDASAISNVPSGNLVATDVQSALNEIQTELDSVVSSNSNKADRDLSNLIAGTSTIDIETSEDINIDATGVSKNINLNATQAVNVIPTLWVTNTLQFTDVTPATISTFDGFDSVNKPSSENINISSGNVTDNASAGDSGSINIRSGNNSGSGDTGDINIEIGTPNTGNSGTININASADKSLLQNHPTGAVSNAIATVQYVDDTVGVSVGDINETTFAGASGAVSANVTGLSFANGSVRSFEAQVSVAVDADSDLFEEFEISGIQRGADWQIIVESVGDDTNVDFNIDNSGQIIYSSPAYTGFNSMDVRFRAKVTGV